MLRKTRGMQLLMGIGIFWAIGSMANFYELELLDWVITTIKPAVILGIIVLLQPELRRVFGDMAKIKVLKFFMLKPTFDVDEVVEAASLMSTTKTGSIIIFSREISLRNIIEQSVQLDAIITSSLLLTIFKKNSALHDGAVIIEQNRIASASSYLPMSNALGTSTLGARHRSALGLAEETDAVILVTSEETGEISICKDGEIYHPIKIENLKDQLHKMLTDKEKKVQPKHRRITAQNMGDDDEEDNEITHK